MHANKLHINMKKCCYMHFRPKISTSNGDQDNNNQHTRIRMNDYEIYEVEETKFLGVTIDNKLTWLPHLKLLAKKLMCCSGQLNSIKNFLPTHLYKNLYHTLFKSHLSYAISVWGGVSEAKMNPLVIAQKHCIRILFGDKEKYLEKRRTAARTRPRDLQMLGLDFFKREHTNRSLTVHNLHSYHSLLSISKIFKFHTPIALHTLFTMSRRSGTLITTSNHSESS